MNPLTRAHMDAQAKLRGVLEHGVRTVWRGLETHDAPDVDPFLARVVPMVLAAQRASVGLTNAYLAAYLGETPVGIETDELIGQGARNGTLLEDVYRRPFIETWRARLDGRPEREALAAGEARAVEAAAIDVQLAMRETLRAVPNA